MQPSRSFRVRPSVWAGFALGAALAGLATYVELQARGGETLADVWAVQREVPYLWILDVLPFALALAAFVVSRRAQPLEGRTLAFLATGLVTVSIVAFGYALQEERTTGVHLSDVNDSGSLRYRSLYIPTLIQEQQPWEDARVDFERVLGRLVAAYPEPGAAVAEAWEDYARGLRENGAVSFETVERLRLAANDMTHSIEAEGLLHSNRAVFGFVLGMIGIMVSLATSVALLLRVSRMQRSLTESERQFRSTFANAPIGMAMVSLEGRFENVNRALCEMLGYDEAGLLAQDFQTITHPEDLDLDLARVQELTDGKETAYRIEKRYFHARGETVWAQLDVSVIRDAAGVPLHFISQIQDITQSRASQRKLQYLATHDSLTGLVKRDVLAESIQRAIALRGKTPSHSYAVLFLDLDGFKQINDTYGHAIGDELLEAIARRVQASVRESDVVARVGGDEFAVLLNGMVAEATAVDMSERIQAVLSRPFHLTGDLRVFSGASIGIALGTDRYASYEDVLLDADHAMYASKARAKGGIALHSDRPASGEKASGEKASGKTSSGDSAARVTQSASSA